MMLALLGICGMQKSFLQKGLKESISSSLLIETKRFYGRKGGSKAGEFAFRPPSKKQIKKRARLMETLSAKRDPRKEKLRSQQLRRMVADPGLKDKIRELDRTLGPQILELTRPKPMQMEALPEPQLPSPSIQPTRLVKILAELAKKKTSITDTNDSNSSNIISSLEQDAVASTALANNADTNNNQLQLTLESVQHECNQSLQHLLVDFRQDRYDLPKNFDSRLVDQFCRHMQTLDLLLDIPTAVVLMRMFTAKRQYHEAVKVFDDVLTATVDDDPVMISQSMIALWSAKLENTARSGDIRAAIDELDRLQKWAKSTDAMLYNPILRAMYDQKQYEEGDEFWLRMHVDGITFTAESFVIAIQSRAIRGEAERAFFLYRELRTKSEKIQPTTEVFTALLDASSRAPYWVNGYEDTIYDAIDLLEGVEFKPNTQIYNAIIAAFANCGDSFTAEYYFWEMRRKGIPQDEQTYIKLLSAYAKAQSIGMKYGWKGRYVKKPPPPLTPEEKAMATIGATRTMQILSSGISSEGRQVGNRTKSTLIDLFDEDEDALEAAQKQIQYEAKEIMRERNANAKKLPQSMLTVRGALDLKREYDRLGLDSSDLANLVDSSDVSYDDLDEYIDLPEELREVKLQQRKVVQRLQAQSSDLSDPFVDAPNLKGLLTLKTVDEQTLQLEAGLQQQAEQQISTLKLLDGESEDHQMALDTLRKQVNREWDFFAFGRAPPPDYSLSPQQRQDINKHRAILLFEDMQQKGIEPSIATWNKLLAVHAEAVKVEEAKAILASMQEIGIAINNRTYEPLIRMHLRNKDLESAIAAKDEAITNKIVPTEESFGMLVQSLARRNETLVALKMLEQASSLGVKLHERNLKLLRAQCEKLGVKHPDLPANPLQWAKDMKTRRRQLKQTSRRKIQRLDSLSFI